MKIIKASRRDDILKEKEEYEADYADRKARYDTQKESYRKADFDAIENLESQIRSKLGNLVEICEIDIQCMQSWNDNNTYDVTIKGNNQSHFDEKRALSWNYDVKIDKDGNVKKETGSWSGLNATTTEAIEDLKNTVKALEILQAIDWKTLLLNNKHPEYGDYITERDPSSEHNKKSVEFDKRLDEADIADIIGTNKAIKSNGGRMYNGIVWKRILKETPSQYTVVEYPNYMFTDTDGTYGPKFYNDYEYRISKDKFMETLVRPFEIKTIDMGE